MAAEKFDLDFWYNPTYNNYYSLLNALESLGFDVLKFKKEKSPKPRNSYFRFEFGNFTIDFLPILKGLSSFPKSYAKRDRVTIDDIELSIISIEDLIAEKSIDSSPKDISDIRELKKRNKES